MNTYIDYTNLKPNTSISQIYNLCQEAIKYDFASVCVQPHFVNLASEYLKETNVKVGTVVGFPLGQNTTSTKIFEAKQAIKDGANEMDMVINNSWVKDKKFNDIENEISQIKTSIEDNILKVIIEISLLTDEEIAFLSKIISKTKAEFIKTSTGFGTHGASLSSIKIIETNKSNSLQIKASGGINDYLTAQAYVDLGVTRIGTSSGLKIMKEKHFKH